MSLRQQNMFLDVMYISLQNKLDKFFSTHFTFDGRYCKEFSNGDSFVAVVFTGRDHNLRTKDKKIIRDFMEQLVSDERLSLTEIEAGSELSFTIAVKPVRQGNRGTASKK
jgi:hypothetical protein